MQGHATQLELRRRIESGEIVGPRLVLAGPALSGNSAADAATAERLVRQQKSQGFDMLKVHEGLSLEAYDAIARTAGELDMQWGGHVSDVVGLEHALEKRQTTIDHVDNYVIDMSREPGAGVTPANIDRSRIALLAKATKDAGVAVVPTMALWEVILGMHPVDGMMSRPELRYMPPATVRTWANNTSARTAQVDPAQSKLEAELRIEMLRALHDAGVPILMGTDAPQLFSVPGFSLERELPVMARAGMTPFEILQTGTTGVAAHFGWNDTGTIAAGKRADLILLDANPLQDIANIGRRAGVMVNGRWLPWSEIQARLDTMAARNGAG
jgi:imidazolonepropionase-like amidohydrolase